MIEATRPQLNAPELRSSAQQAFRKLLFALLPYPARLRALLTPLRLYAGTPLQALARRSGLTSLFGPQLPQQPGQDFRIVCPQPPPSVRRKHRRVCLFFRPVHNPHGIPPPAVTEPTPRNRAVRFGLG
jgi:glycolate oxidase iron-sulfur subunit